MQQIEKTTLMEKIIKNKIHYTEGMFFQIRITSRYLNLMGNQAFEKLKLDLSFEEYIILDIISYNEGICHRDLAKMLLRDRSNIGKIASSLEKKKLIKIKLDIRNNRTVKKIYITEKGIKVCNEIYIKLEPYLKIINETLKKEEQDIVSTTLTKFRNVLENIVETQI